VLHNNRGRLYRLIASLRNDNQIRLMKHYLPLLVLILLAACQSTDTAEQNNFSKCKFGQPQAIFSDSLPTVRSHAFQIQKQSAIEILQFDSGKKLELLQSGCNEIIQELKFTLPNQKIDNWVEATAQELEALGNLSQDLTPFRFWAGAIAHREKDFKLGQDLELDSNVFAKIDKIEASDYSILTVILSQKPSGVK